ncbi:MAG: ATP-binding protein [Candidatus Gracilibacteria bacterium]|nr:ATP-binding protein [Candidatus Gracilibacteria bacterium]MDD2908369.1 ATP-binding protein [Candidatus Gracilibacteria bacterium]
MEPKKINTYLNDDNDILYISEIEEQKFIEDNILYNFENDNKVFAHIPDVTDLEKMNLSFVIDKYKKSITSWWLKHKEMKDFYHKFDLNKEEVITYIDYFGGEKILNHLISNLKQEENEDSNPKSIFISTKFLSFIKLKKLGIEDLLKIVILLKNSVIEHFLDEEIKIINLLNNIFDEISTSLSKNYNDAVIKLLNEYTNAIDSSNIITKTDIYGNITQANDEFCKLSGYTRDELIGKSHNIVRHPDMPKEIFKEMRDTIQNKKIWKGNVKNRTKTGGYYWAKSTIVPILDENDKIVEYISIRTDISELVEANKNIQEYNNAINESSLVIKLDITGTITSANEEYCARMLCNTKNIVGKKFTEVIIVDIEENYIVSGKNIFKDFQDVLSYVQTKKVWKGILKMKTNVGNYIWCSTTIKPILNSDNEIIEFIIIQHDVTDLEIAQQNLKISLKKQVQLDQKKDEFLNIASHELRTPMTSIKGYISMILDGDAGEINSEVKAYLTQVYSSSERLLDLINDMLDISKIESGIQELHYEEINLNNLIYETCGEIHTLFESKKQIVNKFVGFENFLYNTDKNKLKQVLLNLLGNANKFTPVGGEIKLTTYKSDKILSIEIEDNGIGIEAENFSKIFEKFGQVKNSLTRDINGTGLGLPIAKKIIEKMGGFLILESEVGQGSKFTINLPIN